MYLQLSEDEAFSITNTEENLWLGIHALENGQSFGINLLPSRESKPHKYIEIRQGVLGIKIFFFINKKAKKDIDLGIWEHAEIIWSKKYSK